MGSLSEPFLFDKDIYRYEEKNNHKGESIC